MANTAEKFTETVEKTVTEAANNVFELPSNLRDMAEKGVQKARESYETYKSAANDATAVVESTYEAVSRNAAAINKQALAAVKDSVNEGFDHVEALMDAKTFAAAVELQTGFARKQFEAAAEQAKAFQGLFSKAIDETVTPAKDHFSKQVASIKTAF